MKFRELTVLLPCHSWEDLPIYLSGDDAESLLSCWTALWHPALVAAAGSGPQWHQADLPPQDARDLLVLVPTASVEQLPAGFDLSAEAAGALVITSARERPAVLDRALAALDGGDGGVDPDLAADFLALGFAYLQVQVLTRQMRYSGNLDEYQFFRHLVDGAAAALRQQHDEARAKLHACFDLLAAERDHYYSVDAFLLDLTLVAETTMGAALRRELGGGTPLNLLLSGEVLERMAGQEPESVTALAAALGDQRVGLVGGEYTESPLPLYSLENILAELRRGDAVYRRYLDRRVDVFGRRRFGLTPVLPGILEKLRFAGALHATLDDGHFPAGGQIKARWQGPDAGAIDSIAKPPLDATRPETFLRFAKELAESMDSDHVATLCLAHWPGQASPWLDDLRRCARYTSALGKFITVDQYFRETYHPDSRDRFEADQYQSPYLQQAIARQQPDPIRAVARYWARQIACDARRSLEVMAGSVAGEWGPAKAESHEERDRVETGDGVPGPDGTERDRSLDTAVRAAASRLVNAIPQQAGSDLAGRLIVNPFGFTRRVGLEIAPLSGVPAGVPAVEHPVIAAGQTDDRTFLVVELPAMGYVWLPASGSNSGKQESTPPLAEDARNQNGQIYLRNEYFEAVVDPVTGILRSVHDYKSRRNRLSQQLGLRTPGERGQPGQARRDPDETAQYSVMAADNVRVSLANPAVGEVVAHGRLLSRDGEVQAEYRQVLRVWRGSRVLQIGIELQPRSEPGSGAWNSYYACRFAWSEEDASLFASVNQTRQQVRKQRLEAPLYVDIEAGETKTTLLTGGLPFHRRIGSRMLDSLLAVRGERAGRFRLGIGIDLPHALPEALSLLAPWESLVQSSAAPVHRQGWLFHVDARSVVPTHWSLLESDGKVCGIRVRLLESSGRSGRLALAAFRPFQSGRQVNFLGETLAECTVREGRLAVDISAHEWLEVEGRWS